MFRPEPMFDDSFIIANIKDHPMVAWKMLNHESEWMPYQFSLEIFLKGFVQLWGILNSMYGKIEFFLYLPHGADTNNFP